MDLNLESKKELAKELALQLSWEFWMTDHAPIMAEVLEELYDPDLRKKLPGNIKKTAENIQEALDSWWTKFWTEMTTDTTVVGITHDSKEIVIAANIKKRTIQAIKKRGKGGGQHSEYNTTEFGFYDHRHEAAIQRVCETFPKPLWANITVLVPEDPPQNKEKNALLHAEMQIVRYYAEQQGVDIEVLGISKPACVNCAAELDRRGIHYVHNTWNEDGKNNVPKPGATASQGKSITNWASPSDQGFGGVRRHARIQQFRLLRRGESGVQVVRYQPGEKKLDFLVRPEVVKPVVVQAEDVQSEDEDDHLSLVGI